MNGSKQNNLILNRDKVEILERRHRYRGVRVGFRGVKGIILVTKKGWEKLGNKVQLHTSDF